MEPLDLIDQLQFYLRLMSIEAIVYGLYIYHCLNRGATRHRLFYFSVFCFAVLLGEIIRAEGLLLGIFEFHRKHILIFAGELYFFTGAAYEIVTKCLEAIEEKIKRIWITE